MKIAKMIKRLAGSALLAAAIAGSAPSRAQDLESLTAASVALPTVKYVTPYPDYVQTINSSTITPLPKETQRSLSNAAYDSVNGLPVDFPADIAQTAVDYTIGRLERLALVRSLVTNAAGSQPEHPVSVILTPAEGNNVNAYIISDRFGRDGYFLDTIDFMFKTSLTGAGMLRYTNTNLDPLVQAAFVRADQSTDLKSASDARALVYRVESTLPTLPPNIPTGYMYSSNVTGDVNGGSAIGRGLYQAGLLNPAPGLTAGDYSLFELLPSILRFKQGSAGCHNSARVIDTYGILARKAGAGEFQLVLYGVDWVNSGGQLRPQILDSRTVFDLAVGWDAQGNLTTLDVVPDTALSYGTGVSVSVADLRRDVPWEPAVAPLAFYCPDGSSGPEFDIQLQDVLGNADEKYAKIPWPGA